MEPVQEDTSNEANQSFEVRIYHHNTIEGNPLAYDALLAEKVRTALGLFTPYTFVEKKMFGGVAFTLQGNMLCGVLNASLIVRIGTTAYEAALRFPFVKPFDVTGRTMKGWIMIEDSALDSTDMLHEWLKKGVDFVSTLPPK